MLGSFLGALKALSLSPGPLYRKNPVGLTEFTTAPATGSALWPLLQPHHFPLIFRTISGRLAELNVGQR